MKRIYFWVTEQLHFFNFGLMALALASSLSFTGCSKSDSDSDPVYKDGCFKYDDKTYNSLSAAMRVALDNEDEKEKIIYLLDNVMDNEPLSIDDYDYDEVTFNLGGFTYVSANGLGLDFKDVVLNLSGEGNFECRNGALSSESCIEVTENFQGKISTPVILDEAVMLVNSPKAMANISRLKVDGNGLFSMEVVSEKPASIVIDRLTASDDDNVCAIDGKSVVVKEGGKVHVHNYKLVEEVHANCCNAGYKVYQCEYCLEDYTELNEGETGSCIAEDLIHHAAVTPTDTEYGNLEYWECPDCGECYSDAEGKNSIVPILLPKNYDLPLNILFGCDEALGQQNITIDYKEIAKKGLNFLVGLFKSKYEVTNEQLLEEMKKLSAQISQLSQDVAKLREAVDGLYKEVQNITLGRGLSEYTSRIVLLANTTLKYYQTYENILNNNLPLEQKNAEINELFKDFDNELGTAKLDAELLYLLNFYCENTTFEQVMYKNIPEAQEKFTQNIFLWENMGYLLRTSITVTDFQRLSSSYVIINAYLNWTGKAQNIQQMNNIKTSLEKCMATMEADLQRIEDRDVKYRIYCGGNRGELVYYQRPYFELGTKIQDWFESENNRKKNYFPRAEKQKGIAIKSCEQILSDVGLPDGFIEIRHLVATYEKYKDRIGNNTTANIMEFIGFPKMLAYDFFITESTGDKWYDYGHLDENITLPHYKIFEWYKSKGCSAYFKVRCINKPETEVHLNDWWWLREGMSMWASDGYISWPGYKRTIKYYTIKKLNIK